jgi:cell division protein FtsB
MFDSILDVDKEKLLETGPPARTEMARLKALALAASAVGAVAYGALRDDEGMMHVFRERSRLQELRGSVTSLREENNRLRNEIKALREDPRAVEKLAREDLGLSREGEIVFILESENAESTRKD